jgi:hypothetical protein
MPGQHKLTILPTREPLLCQPFQSRIGTLHSRRCRVRHPLRRSCREGSDYQRDRIHPHPLCGGPSKTWAGLTKEMLTPSDHYQVEFTGSVPATARTLTVMMAVVLDLTSYGPV